MRDGQHFMIDEQLLHRIVGYAEIQPDDRVLEIGPGKGALTKLLGKKLTAIEKDPELAKKLSSNFDIINADALKVKFPKFDKLVANIPYLISKPLTIKLLQNDFKEAVLVTQLEFAQKLVAEPGQSNYGLLSAFLHSQAEVEILERVHKNAFAPQPKVESAVVKIKRTRPPLDPGYLDFLRLLFTQKRKTLRKFIPTQSDKRIIELTPEELLKLYNDS